MAETNAPEVSKRCGLSLQDIEAYMQRLAEDDRRRVGRACKRHSYRNKQQRLCREATKMATIAKLLDVVSLKTCGPLSKCLPGRTAVQQ